MKSRIFQRGCAGALLLCCAAMAQAQYMWIDAKGVKQYSDRPPPTSVPLKDIKKAPKGQPSADLMPAADAAAPPAPASKAPPSLAEREADFNKRQKDAAAREKTAHEEQEQRAALAENCERMRASKAALDGGARIRTNDKSDKSDKNGERGYMDEAQRAAESKWIDKNLSRCKD